MRIEVHIAIRWNETGHPGGAGRAERLISRTFTSSLSNALALPGGHVFIGRGLLRVMDSEDELAAVLGHEIEHIDHYHCAERFGQFRSGLGTASPLLSTASIGLAVAGWPAGRTEEALGDFELAAKNSPQWLNPKWIGALYSPLVARSIAEMQDEQQKRPLAKGKK